MDAMTWLWTHTDNAPLFIYIPPHFAQIENQTFELRRSGCCTALLI